MFKFPSRIRITSLIECSNNKMSQECELQTVNRMQMASLRIFLVPMTSKWNTSPKILQTINQNDRSSNSSLHLDIYHAVNLNHFGVIKEKKNIIHLRVHYTTCCVSHVPNFTRFRLPSFRLSRSHHYPERISSSSLTCSWPPRSARS